MNSRLLTLIIGVAVVIGGSAWWYISQQKPASSSINQTSSQEGQSVSPSTNSVQLPAQTVGKDAGKGNIVFLLSAVNLDGVGADYKDNLIATYKLHME